MKSANSGQTRVVLVSAGDEAQAAAIARILVEERLAACVNIVGPMRSIYRWRDAIEDDQEYLLVIKSRARLLRRIEKRVRELHSYEVPEVIALAIVAGHQPYLDWLFESTAPRSATRSPRQA